MTTLLEQLIDLLDNDANSWSEGSYTLDHKNGYSIWIGSYVSNLNLYRPYKSDFGRRERSKLARAIKRWRNRPLPTSTKETLYGLNGVTLTCTTKDGGAA